MTGWKNTTLRVLLRSALTSACVLNCVGLAAAHDVALIASKNSRVKSVKGTDLARMIKATHQWADGRELIVVLDPSSLEMRIVAQKLLSLTRDEFRRLIDATNKTKKTFWVVSSDDEALKVLQGNPSAIGLVNVYSINSSVDVLKIDSKLPLEPGYVLHSQ